MCNYEGCGAKMSAPFCGMRLSRLFCVMNNLIYSFVFTILYFNRKSSIVNRQSFFTLVLCIMFFSTGVFDCVRVANAAPEVRGLWVVRDRVTTPEKVKNLIEFADRHHINVLFVQVRGRGDAFYKSYFVPGPDDYPSIPEFFDPLAEVITQAHARGIEVHAWVNMYLTWSSDEAPADPEHPLNKHPEWFMVSIDGQSMADCPIEFVRNDSSEGRYISPRLDEVRSYLSRMITEIAVTYAVDGIHMDYIRYPGREYDFHPVVCSDFSNRFGLDPRKVVTGDSRLDPTLAYLGKWVEYRAEQIDAQVRSVIRRINLVDKNIRLSAAVKHHVDEAYYCFGQDWAGWVREGLVDFVVTMSYLRENDELFEVMSTNIEKVDKRKIIGGIGVYLLQPEKTAEQISLVREMGFLGYCLFSYSAFLEGPYSDLTSDLLALPVDDGLPREFKPYIRAIHEW